MSDGGQFWTDVRDMWRTLPSALRWALMLVSVSLLVVVLIVLLSPGKDTSTAFAYPTPIVRLSSFSPAPDTGSPPPLLDDGRLFYEPGWGALEVRQFLESRPGVLAGWYSWVGNQETPLADLIVGQSLFYRVNPKVILTLLEMQSGLLDQPNPAPEVLDWAMGYHNDAERGLESQIQWAVLEVFRATRDYPEVQSLALSDGQRVPLPANVNLGSYAVLRVVAQTCRTEADLEWVMGADPEAFVQTYRRLFDEDPRSPLEGLRTPAQRAFLKQPYLGTYEVTSIFDHHYPFLNEDGAIVSYMGDDAQGLPYEGHNGWDYALDFGVPVWAAADGVVIWAGNSDDGCATAARGVILDHENGYRTVYWHLDRVDVRIGQRVSQGETLGLGGASGCANGPHLHFGVHFRGRETDPEGWCGEGPDPWAAHPAGTASRWLWADRFSACGPPAQAILVDSDDPDFQRSGERWDEGRGAVGGSALWAPSEPRSGVVKEGQSNPFDGVVEAGIWRPTMPEAGRYHVYAFVPYWYNNTPDTQAARYIIHHADGEDLVLVDQSLHVNYWVDLGVYSFLAGREGFVYLNNMTDESGFCVWFDAILWVSE